MSAVDRAEAVDAATIAIRMVWSDVGPTTADVLAANVVRFLDAAGLLVSDEIQAVLAAAIWFDQETAIAADGIHPWQHMIDLSAAVEAYLASRPS